MSAARRTLSAELAQLWEGLRLVVLDVETTVPPKTGPLRAVSLAAVTCRDGSTRGAWHTFINPEVPIDAHSSRIHGIFDDLVVSEPTFADVAHLLADTLRERADERVVLCAHNVRFDASVLRAEFKRAGVEMPDVAVLDTMGKLTALAGVRPASKSLADLLVSLGLTNARPHDALADAQACAQAALVLLQRVAAAGHTNFDDVLQRVSGRAHTLGINPSRARQARVRKVTVVSASTEHLDSHAVVLSARASRKRLWDWGDQVAECGVLRCELVDDRVREGLAPLSARVTHVETALQERVDAGDTPGAATVLAALVPILAELHKRSSSQHARSAALAWQKAWAPALAALGRCDDDDLCPACRRGEACALDTWPESIARTALGDLTKSARSVLAAGGKGRGTGIFTTWRSRNVDPRVADAAVWLTVQHYRENRDLDGAMALIQQAWRTGCRHPELASDYAARVAAPGRDTDLTRAIEICDEALATRGNSSAEGWNRLLSRRQQLDGRARRLATYASKSVDAQGNPVAVRAHTPAQPRRTRTPRFARP